MFAETIRESLKEFKILKRVFFGSGSVFWYHFQACREWSFLLTGVAPSDFFPTGAPSAEILDILAWIEREQDRSIQARISAFLDRRIKFDVRCSTK